MGVDKRLTCVDMQVGYCIIFVKSTNNQGKHTLDSILLKHAYIHIMHEQNTTVLRGLNSTVVIQFLEKMKAS